jgi:hypothetical protein
MVACSASLAAAPKPRGDQRPQVSIPFHTTEALDSFDDAGRDPPQHHLPLRQRFTLRGT